jgi:hypothetical protein
VGVSWPESERRLDGIAGARIKVKRAEQHLHELHDVVGAFFREQPYPYAVETKTEEDSGKRMTVRSIHILRKPDPMIGAVAGDLVNCLRSALNYTWSAVWMADGFVSKNPNRFEAFPSGDRANGLERLRKAVETPRHHAAVELVSTLNPYDGGNKYLEAIIKASNEDKHGLLLPVATSIDTVNLKLSEAIKAGIRPDLAPLLQLGDMIAPIPIEPICPVEEGAILQRFDADGKVDMNPDPKFDISLAKPEFFRGKRIGLAMFMLLEFVKDAMKLFRDAGLLQHYWKTSN